MFSLQYIAPALNERPVTEALTTILPWGLLPMSISITLGFHLYRKLPNGKGNRVLFIETWTTSLFAMVATLLALGINRGINPNDAFLEHRLYFALCSAALLGSTIGSIVPYRYRKQKEKMTQVKIAPVHLKKAIDNCVHFGPP